MKFTFIRRSVVGAAMTLALASIASADTVYYEAELFGGSILDTSGPGFVPGNAGPLPKFNVPGAVLQSVQLFYYYDVAPFLDIYNFSTSSTFPFTEATGSVPLTLTGPGGAVIPVTVSYGPINSGDSTPSATNAPPITKGMNVPKMVGSTPGSVTYTGPETTGAGSTFDPNLLAYVGSGNFFSTLIAVEDAASASGKGNSKLAYSAGAFAGGKIGVLYTYAATPEPMTMMLVGSAVLGLGLMLRKRGNSDS